MILAISTSSGWASAALMSLSGDIVQQGRELAPMRASGACLSILESFKLDDITLCVADLGPGSFTGVRVGVTLAKSLSYVWGVPCAGTTSFDLISTERTAAIPSRKGEYFIRVPGGEPYRTSERPLGDLTGFGPWFENNEKFPDATRFAGLISQLEPLEPENLLPTYLLEPSISLPKRPFAGGSTG